MSILSDAWRRARGDDDAVSRALGAPALPGRQRWRRILPWSISAVLLIVLVGLGVYMWRSAALRPPGSGTRTVKTGGNGVPGSAATVMPASKRLAKAGLRARITQSAKSGTHESAAPSVVRTAQAGKDEKKAQPRTQPVVAARAAQTVPDAVRAALPPLKVTVHVWNPRPSARFIIVGGHVYHEGDRLGPQLRLVSITQSGQIVDFRGYLITLSGQ